MEAHNSTIRPFYETMFHINGKIILRPMSMTQEWLKKYLPITRNKKQVNKGKIDASARLPEKEGLSSYMQSIALMKKLTQTSQIPVRGW